MAILKRDMVLLMVLASLQASMGAVYKVGDSDGWTIIGNVDYKKWAASKAFHVGDTILFEYNVKFHNVMQVTHSEYQSCNASAPIATYSTGKDSITVKRPGHYYFLCGFPGHCQAGQKVDIRIAKVPTSTAPGPAPLSPSASPPGSEAPAPSSKNSGSLPSKGWFLGTVALVIAIFAGFAY